MLGKPVPIALGVELTPKRSKDTRVGAEPAAELLGVMLVQRPKERRWKQDMAGSVTDSAIDWLYVVEDSGSSMQQSHNPLVRMLRAADMIQVGDHWVDQSICDGVFHRLLKP